MLSFPFLPAYIRFVAIATSEVGYLWEESRWSGLMYPVLDPYVRSLGGEVSIYVRALASGSKSNNVTLRGWSESLPNRWSMQLAKSRFVDLQLFAPPRSERSERRPFPKLYVQLQPVTWEGAESKMAYDQILHIAVKQSDFQSKRELIETAIRMLQLDAGIIGVYSCRSRISTVNSFESLVREDFMYRGMLSDVRPDLGRTKIRWIEWNQTNQ